MIFITVGGDLVPASPTMQMYFCTPQVAQDMLTAAKAVLPDATLQDNTDKQTAGQFFGPAFTITADDPRRFFEISGNATAADATVPVLDNCGFLACRKANRRLQPFIDQTSGDNMKLQVLPVGIGQLYWGN